MVFSVDSKFTGLLLNYMMYTSKARIAVRSTGSESIGGELDCN